MLKQSTIDTITKVVQEEASDLPLYNILGLVEKESNGVFFWGNTPIFNIEGHYFYRYLGGKQREEAIAAGLAAKSAGKVKVPAKSNARITMLNRMCAINKTAALQSISMGVGQVMGAHWKKLGYPSVDAMWYDAHTEAGQVRIMLKFIEQNHNLRIAIHNNEYDAASAIYNGPKYKKNNYAVDWKRYAARYRTGVPVVESNLVKEKSLYEARIKALGFVSVIEFQQQAGLNPDGIIGKLTKEAVNDHEERVHAEQKKPELAVAKTAAGAFTLGGLGLVTDNANTAIAMVRPVLDSARDLGDYGGPLLLYGGIGVGIALTAAYVYKRFARKRENPVIAETLQ